MELSDLLISYNQVRTPTLVLFPELLSNYSYDYPVVSQTTKKEEEKKEEDDLTSNYYISTIKAPGFSKVKGSAEFELAYNEVEKTNPEARKYRTFLTKMALKESGFNKSIQNLAGAPAYGYFLFMLDGKKYNNISKFAGTDIETFRNNPKLQIEAAIKLAKSFEKGFSKEDLKLAKELGFTTFGLLGGAWLAGNKGVRKYLKGQGNPSDRHWSKDNKGTDVATRIREFNFKSGGVIRKYLNAGTIESDNTRVSKPIILLKIPMTYHLPLFVQDNRSSYEKEQSLKQADAAYNLYIEDKKTEKGLNDLIGFLTFTDYATMGLGAGSLLTKGAKLIGKRIAKNNINKDLPRIGISELVLSNTNIPKGEYKLPSYAKPNSSSAKALDYHLQRINLKFNPVPLIEYFDVNDDIEKYKIALYNLLKKDFPNESESSILKTINEVIRENPAFSPSNSNKVFTNREILKLIYGSNSISKILSHEVDHAINIPIRPAEGFDLKYLQISTPSNTNYFIRRNNTDLAARGTQIKDYFGLTSPDLEITEDMLKYAALNYVRDTGMNNAMTEFFNSITDWKKAAKWLSEAATIYAGILNNQRNDKK